MLLRSAYGIRKELTEDNPADLKSRVGVNLRQALFTGLAAHGGAFETPVAQIGACADVLVSEAAVDFSVSPRQEIDIMLHSSGKHCVL